MNQQKIKTILAELLGVSPDEIPDNASWETYPAWTSLVHLEFMMALETEFQLGLKTEDILRLNSLQSIGEYLAAQGK